MATLEEIQKRFTDEVRYVDDVAQVVLKGHLVLEDLMTESLQTYLLHGEFIELARLQFHQKLALCRGIATTDHKNNMWNLVGRVNSLRNALSHSLDPDRRSKAIEELRLVYEQEFKDTPGTEAGIPVNIEKDISKELALCLYAIAGCLGYVHSHVEEVKRLKSLILTLDGIFNKGALAKSK